MKRKTRMALAANGREERDTRNPFRCRRGELTTSDMRERDKVLSELIEWLGGERDYVLQWRGKDGKDVLADHLGDFDSEGVLEPCINGHGRIVCGWMAKGPDIEDWYGHLAAAMEDGLDSVAAEVVGGHGPDSEPGE